MAPAWSWKTLHGPAFLILCALVALDLHSAPHAVHAFFHVEHPDTATATTATATARRSPAGDHTSFNHLDPASCACLLHDDPLLLRQHQQCPSQPYPFCLHGSVESRLLPEEAALATSPMHTSDDNHGDHIIAAPAEATNSNGEHAEHKTVEGSADSAATGRDDKVHQPSAVNHPASSPTIAGSTAVVYSRDPDAATHDRAPGKGLEATTTNSPHAEITAGSIAVSPSQSARPRETRTDHARHKKIPAHASVVSAAPSPTSYAPSERHIPSYEQWRKQVLEKKKPADLTERKLRKRKPYQESAEDVALGAEDELGFIFPNMDNGNGNVKGGDNHFQQISDQLGSGPDPRQSEGRDKEWIKAEYAKDPKDRFNHASATCAASVVKASKDATSIMAILNEGKDNYMLNKCSTKEKFFVVELCEEILVDTFVLGNYEFFSSTFKDIVVSVNRYPPRDEGWSTLGHFQARNTRDAQVFRPAVPQLATYIRFDFLSHYGNEYYCPVTLLRVYGATALEQLKQEEEEEKRQAEEEKRLAELEKTRQAAAEAEDAEDTEDAEDAEDTEEAEAADTDESGVMKEGTTAIEVTQLVESDLDAHLTQLEMNDSLASSGPPSTSAESPTTTEAIHDLSAPAPQDMEIKNKLETGDDRSSLEHSEAESSTFVFLEGAGTKTGDTQMDDTTAGHVVSSDTILKSFEETTATSTVHVPTDVFPPRASTSPASMQDDGDWRSSDLGMMTLSPKARPTQLPKPPMGSKPSSGGVGTTVSSASPTTDSSSHPSPSPQHSSQESVYKNIVNRLKVLELNSTLSYQYLEEQSNIYNEVLESGEQKMNQLVSHLNEATRRLEALGRKYDQLAYSYRAHVEVDGEKRRQDFINLTTQVHVLGAQVMFQRQLFVVGAITLFSIIAFIAITRSTTMHYALQQSPLGAKLRAISGQRRETHSNDIASSVRIGSVEGLTQFDQTSRLLHRTGARRNSLLNDEPKLTPPISPMEPLTPDPNHAAQSRLLDDRERPIAESTHSSSDMPLRREDGAERGHSGNGHLPQSNAELSSQAHQIASSNRESISGMQIDQLENPRASYSTSKNGFGPGRLLVHANLHNFQQLAYLNDYRPESPVFQGPSGVHDEGQLSDADVAYMSQDMNVGRRITSNPGSNPTSPGAKRLSSGYYNHMHHQAQHPTASRPMSSLRMSLARSESDSPEALQLSPEDDNHSNGDFPDTSTNESSQLCKNEDRARQTNSGIDAASANMVEEDVGFVSDSVLDSTSGTMARNRDPLQPFVSLGDWEKQHGVGEVMSYQDVGEAEEYNVDFEARPLETTSCDADTATRDTTKTSKSRRRNSHSIVRTQEYPFTAQYKSYSASANVTLGLAADLGVETNSEHPSSSGGVVARPESPLLLPAEWRGRGESEGDDGGVDADNDSAIAPHRQVLSERRKKNRRSSVPDDQSVPRRRVSYGRIESMETEAVEDNGLDGDDEGSPQMSRTSGS